MTVSPDDYSSGQCGNGFKACFGECVSIDDPKTGCGNSDCGPCRIPGAAASCRGGQCVIGLCMSGFDNCDGDANNGCEADVKNEAYNCGYCQRTCPGMGKATGVCRTGVCGLACPRGSADCKDAKGACETNTESDNANCGACRNACAGGMTCVAGSCAAMDSAGH